MNKGLSTLQFQSLSVAADNPKHLQGGTQDNGTFETYGSAVVWPQIIYGDGGQSGFNATNSSMRFNTFTRSERTMQISRMAIRQSGSSSPRQLAGSPEVSHTFTRPIIADPNAANAGTIFQGSQSVWRTQDWGGDQATLEANCPEFTTSADQPGAVTSSRSGRRVRTDLTGTLTADRLAHDLRRRLCCGD